MTAETETIIIFIALLVTYGLIKGGKKECLLENIKIGILKQSEAISQ